MIRHITTTLLVLFFSFLYGGNFLSAQQETPCSSQPNDNCGQRGTGPCGCHCPPDCHCGCEYGKACDCGPDCPDCTDCPKGCDPIDWSFIWYGPSEADDWYAHAYGRIGYWLPEDPVLFKPFLADPRQIDYSVGWRFNDQVLVKNVIDVSFGDSIAIYRWVDILPWKGDLQIDLEGAVWACFDPLHDSAPLMNADYYVGFPLTYAVGPWQFRLRPFHISSHMGDEYLLNHPGFIRRNPSAEYIDFFVSHNLTEQIRIYGGVGWVVAQDKSYHIGKVYAAAGGELYFTDIGFLDCRQQIYGVPFYAMYFRWRSHDFKRHLDSTYALGYEFGKTCGLCRKVRFYMEYHDGYSLEGQFDKFPTSYFSLRMSYGF